METKNNNLKFIETFTVEQFKNENNVNQILIKQNPKNGKLFFTYGAKTGAVSANGIPEHPMISLVEGDNNEQFYLLHDEPKSNAPVIETL